MDGRPNHVVSPLTEQTSLAVDFDEVHRLSFRSILEKRSALVPDSHLLARSESFRTNCLVLDRLELGLQ